MSINMQICSNLSYRLKNNEHISKSSYSFMKLIRTFDISTIKRFLAEQKIILNFCGKCDYCNDLRQQSYIKRVKSQFKMSKYSYLITLTFSNDKINMFLPKKFCKSLKPEQYSQFSNLSKIEISNIIKNWKNKLNRFYRTKIKLHYFLCGEYGSLTNRSHYHILLMLDYPLPNLEKQNIKGNHFKSSLIDSKQYSMYDIEATNKSISCSSYISKYLAKSKKNNKSNYNYFETKQLKWYIENCPYDFEKYFLFKDKEQLLKFLLLYELEEYEYIYNCFKYNVKTFKKVNKQSEFLKTSRKLGISNDIYFNIINGVINNYYFNKLKFEYFNCWNLLNTLYFSCICFNNILYVDLNIGCYLLYIYMYYLIYIIKFINTKKKNNIYKYFYKNLKITKKVNDNGKI